MPEELKQKVTSYVEMNKSKYSSNVIENFNRFLTWMNKPSEEHVKVTYSTEGEFLIKGLDKVRKTSYVKLFPWLDKIFDYQKKIFTDKLDVI